MTKKVIKQHHSNGHREVCSVNYSGKTTGHCVRDEIIGNGHNPDDLNMLIDLRVNGGDDILEMPLHVNVPPLLILGLPTFTFAFKG